MSEAAFKLVETNDVETKALSIVDQARQIKVIDGPTYIAAGELYKDIVAVMKEVDDSFDKNIKRWHDGHKDAIADKAKHWNPLDAAKRAVKRLMSDYDAEQERIRKAEEERLREIERKAEEERRLKEAIALEESGQKEIAEEVMEAPVVVAPVVLPKATPKLQGGPVYREIWDFEIIDINLIPRQYMQPNTVAIGGVVRSLKGQTNIPGIKAFSRRV